MLRANSIIRGMVVRADHHVFQDRKFPERGDDLKVRVNPSLQISSGAFA
jgi:hypothetical protein